MQKKLIAILCSSLFIAMGYSAFAVEVPGQSGPAVGTNGPWDGIPNELIYFEGSATGGSGEYDLWCWHFICVTDPSKSEWINGSDRQMINKSFDTVNHWHVGLRVQDSMGRWGGSMIKPCDIHYEYDLQVLIDIPGIGIYQQDVPIDFEINIWWLNGQYSPCEEYYIEVEFVHESGPTQGPYRINSDGPLGPPPLYEQNASYIHSESFSTGGTWEIQATVYAEYDIEGDTNDYDSVEFYVLKIG